MCKLRMLNDIPITMQEREFGEIYSGHQAGFHSLLFMKAATEAEVMSMYINGAEPYRKKKAITKIFRRSKYSPGLEDIEEENIEMFDSNRIETSLDLSLTCIHLERAISAGVMAQESRRRRRKSAMSSSKVHENKERRRRKRCIGEDIS